MAQAGIAENFAWAGAREAGVAVTPGTGSGTLELAVPDADGGADSPPRPEGTAVAGGGAGFVVIGGSAGAFQVMRGLLEALPPSLPAALALVIHRSPYFESRLASVLGTRSRLPVLEPRDGDPVRHGTVFIASRDQHLIFDGGVVRLYRGPREHQARLSLVQSPCERNVRARRTAPGIPCASCPTAP
jgi:chemotaxis response regulator CheB